MMNKRITKIRSFIFIAFFIVGVFAFSLILLTLTDKYYKNVVIVNYYPEEVEVHILNKIIKVAPFEIKNLKLLTDEPLLVDAKKSGDNIQLQYAQDIIESIHLSVIPISDESVCFASADVTEYYYSNTENPIPKSITELEYQLEGFEFESITQSNSIQDPIYVYPGNASLNMVPVKTDKAIIGVYPILCDQINEKEIDKLVKLYMNYDDAAQRNFYESRLTQIESLTVEDLDSY